MAFFKPTTVQDYLHLLRRVLGRKWLIGGVFFVVTAAVTVWAVKRPKQYKSTALILIEQGSFASVQQGSRAMNIEQRLRNLRPVITSRTNVESVVKKFRLFPDWFAGGQPMDKVVEHAKRFIEVQVQGYDSFRISFKHKDPQVAFQVTDHLSRLVIDESVNDSARTARKRVDFLRSQRDSLEAEIKEWDEKIRQFQEEHQIDSAAIVGGSRAMALSEQLKTIGSNLRAAQNRKLLLQRQLSVEEKEGGSVAADPRVAQLEGQEADARTRLKQLKEVYTDSHPDVITAREELARVQAQLRTAKSQKRRPSANPRVAQIRQDLAEVDLEIRELKSDRSRLQTEIRAEKADARKKPALQAQLEALQRSRGQVTTRLTQLGQQLAQAEQSAKVAESDGGEQFRLQDPANVPNAPDSAPNAVVAAAGAFVGLLSGVFLALVLVYFDQRVYNEYELSRVVDVPVLVSIGHYEVKALPGVDLPEGARPSG